MIELKDTVELMTVVDEDKFDQLEDLDEWDKVSSIYDNYSGLNWDKVYPTYNSYSGLMWEW